MCQAVHEWMQRDWDARAREDAYYYAAFGRRGQPDEEFFETAREILPALLPELARLPQCSPRARRALEIGCGPGRLIRALSPYFGEIHGVDVSAEMIRLAREKLRSIRHAHFHHVPDSTLELFADESFDFVYSYAVFQHIPDRRIVYRYFCETRRVLRTGGIARLQVIGLPGTQTVYDTWQGVRISAEEIKSFTRQHDLQLLALEGAGTQYLWTTWRKKPEGWSRVASEPTRTDQARIRRVTSAHSSEPFVPVAGRFAAISLWVENLPEECDLNWLEVLVDGRPAEVTYIGPQLAGGLYQVAARLPQGLRTGLAEVALRWGGSELCEPARVRLIPPPPRVPRLVRVADGQNVLLTCRVVSGIVKVTLEEIVDPHEVEARLGGRRLELMDAFCVDARVPTWELNFAVGEAVGRGAAVLEVALGGRKVGEAEVEVFEERG